MNPAIRVQISVEPNFFICTVNFGVLGHDKGLKQCKGGEISQRNHFSCYFLALCCFLDTNLRGLSFYCINVYFRALFYSFSFVTNHMPTTSLNFHSDTSELCMVRIGGVTSRVTSLPYHYKGLTKCVQGVLTEVEHRGCLTPSKYREGLVGFININTVSFHGSNIPLSTVQPSCTHTCDISPLWTLKTLGGN